MQWPLEDLLDGLRAGLVEHVQRCGLAADDRLLLDGLVHEVVGNNGCLEVGDRDLVLAAIEIVDHAPPLFAMRTLGRGNVLPQVGAATQVVLGVIDVRVTYGNWNASTVVFPVLPAQ